MNGIPALENQVPSPDNIYGRYSGPGRALVARAGRARDIPIMIGIIPRSCNTMYGKSR